jgi:membrane-associated phospholipid phosphatase
MPSGPANAIRPFDDKRPMDARPMDGLPRGLREVGRERSGSGRYPRLTAAASVLAVGYVVVAGTMLALGLLVTKLLANGPVGRADESATRWLSQHRDGVLDFATSVLSRSADTVGAIAVALLVVIVLARRRHWHEVGVLVAGLALELLTFLAVNFLVDRPRPAVPKLGSVPSTSSFPSGHCAAALVIYASIAIFVSANGGRRAMRALAWAGALIMPLAVGFARVYRGMHHPLDVAAGLVMGAAVLAVALAAFRAADVAAARAEPRSSGPAPLEREPA